MNQPDLYRKADEINSKKDFEEFIELLYQDFKTNEKDWENNRLDIFLEALRAYSKDIDGYYKNMNIPFDPDKPSWKDFAQILLGAKVYE